MSNPMYQAFVLVPPAHAPTVEAAEAAIRALYAPAGDRVLVTLRDGTIRPWLVVSNRGYELRVALHMGPGAEEESREIAQRSAKGRADQALIASCPARFEVWAEGFDDSLSYHGDYELLVEALERLYPGAVPFEPGASLFRSNRGAGGFLRPPAAGAKLAAAREAVAGVELIAEKKPVKAKRPQKTEAKAKAKAKAADDDDDEPAAKPLARGAPLARGKPMARGAPLARGKGLTRKTPLGRGKGLTRKTPLARGKPMARGEPLDRAVLAKKKAGKKT